MAVDMVPLQTGTIEWNKLRHFDVMAGVVLAAAADLGIHIRWGGDWDGDLNVYDQEFNDLCHFEIDEPVPEP
jgi:peptidoglycan L-alanyl-D-glutamate endopeptidase CwlK